ncbi:hypothetical protein KIV65_gp13 [Mycobacterium phage Anthony]|uniref:Uncharacterized protein n=1 Tax=Mycobacterium phage Anthony TaxID=2599857 RepID=A0A5J6TKA4_9CAUD|nr:hypothetical protein KIV65_gp13 [Mycobacterium phage Anthony]QFG10454.1 hypothetical protein PBI_ANTHONY_84 [Mycobacterium phage Anthony]
MPAIPETSTDTGETMIPVELAERMTLAINEWDNANDTGIIGDVFVAGRELSNCAALILAWNTNEAGK